MAFAVKRTTEPPAVPSTRFREQGRLVRQIKTGVSCFRQQQSHVPLSSKNIVFCVQQPRLHSPDSHASKTLLGMKSTSDITQGNGASDQKSQQSVGEAEKPQPQEVSVPQTSSSPSLSEQMVNLAQDAEVLQLFFPYLPKNQRSRSGLANALTIPGFQKQLLTGEAQTGDSELVHRLREAAPDRKQFNQQLQKLGFYSLLN